MTIQMVCQMVIQMAIWQLAIVVEGGVGTYAATRVCAV